MVPSLNARRILLDTNIFLLPEQCRIDVFAEIPNLVDVPVSLEVLEGTIRELERLASGSRARTTQKDRLAAKIGLELLQNHLKAKDLKSVAQSPHNVDDALCEAARDDPLLIVATADAGLKRRLRRIGTAIIAPRQKKYLILQE